MTKLLFCDIQGLYNWRSSCKVNIDNEYLIWESCAMSQRQILILSQFKGIPIVTVIITFTVLGYAFYHYQMVEDQFDHLVSYAAERTLLMSDDKIDSAETISDVGEAITNNDTTLQSITVKNKRNLQNTDDEWGKIYKYADKFQVK
jgi:lipopolysaccharide export LptBFGC system permease protein LptF